LEKVLIIKKNIDQIQVYYIKKHIAKHFVATYISSSFKNLHSKNKNKF